MQSDENKSLKRMVNNKAVTRIWASSKQKAECHCEYWSVDKREENSCNETRKYSCYYYYRISKNYISKEDEKNKLK